MPELPEVETIRRGLQDLIVGYQIVGMQTDSPKQVVPSLGLVATAIQGGTLLRVDRRAKILLLFLAGIDPARPAKSLLARNASRSDASGKAPEIKSLRETIIKVLKLGLKDGGASDQYYLNAKGEKGFYQEHFLVYGLQGKPCQNHCGGLIKRIVVGGRGTFICPACQR